MDTPETMKSRKGELLMIQCDHDNGSKSDAWEGNADPGVDAGRRAAVRPCQRELRIKLKDSG